MTKYSIVIPTYNHLQDCLEPCLQSLIQHTDFKDVEVIIVANGCTDNTVPFVKTLAEKYPFRLIVSEQPLGYTKATNLGIKASSGQFVILLNNDNVIMPSDKSWIQILQEPMTDEMVAITGAAKNFHRETGSEFLLFFCVMIRRSVFNVVGYLDEEFNPGYGEDIDFCNKLRFAGYKIVQVPDDIHLTDIRPRESHTIKFPIWHKGSVTVNEISSWSVVVPRNELLLIDRYGKKHDSVNIGNLLDTIHSSNVTSTIDRITSYLSEEGEIHAQLNARTKVTISKTGYANSVFLGYDGMRNLSYEHRIVKKDTIEDIKDHVLNCGSKNLEWFGGKWVGGYCTQQNPDEVSEYLFDNRNRSIKNYLEIGVADGGVTRLFCDVVDVDNVYTIDLGWADMNYPYTYRNGLFNLKNTGSINVFRGNSHSDGAKRFLKDVKFDFVFIDADHTYDAVVKDTMLAKEHALPGCIFAYHDHIAVPEVGQFFNDMRAGKFHGFRFLKEYVSPDPTVKGISTFVYEGDPKKYSIVIPTFNHLEDCLKPCLKSIINTTDLSCVEVIVVANGCTDDTRSFVESLGEPFKLIWIPEQVGFIKATNEGIKASTGKYIVLLNNDTEVVGRDWLDILAKPFGNSRVGMTGPYKDWRFFWEDGFLRFRQEYMVFYCAMIRRQVFDKIGLLDENFGLGYEEDIDFAVRLKQAGYTIVQVPNDIPDELQVTKDYLLENPNRNNHIFPVKHKDKMTFKDIRFDNRRKTSLLDNYPGKPDISIIIPTYTNEQGLRKCIDSLIKQTKDFSNIEVIVVANGASETVREYVHGLGSQFKLYWFDKPVGFIKAVNAGVKQSMGDVVIILNDDVELTAQPPSLWLNMLLEPFSKYESVGITGPMKAWRDDIKEEYLLFWCVAIKKDVFKRIGMLDENFGLGYHEDVDFCIRAHQAGFDLFEVPDNIDYSEEFKGDPGRIGRFPITHKGGGTFQKIYGDSDERLKKHLHILYDKYLKMPELPQGWFGHDDQVFHKALMENIPYGGTLIEIGVWKGLSLCSAAHMIKEKNIKVIAIDTFEGSPWEENGAIVEPGLDLKQEFINNLHRFGIADHVQIYAMPSLDAAKLIADNTADLIFIDGDHRYESVVNDTNAWLPKVKSSGIISGHDIYWNDSVAPAVFSVFGQDNVYTGANIWYVLPQNRKRKRMVIDTFIFFNELEVLEIRLNELKDVVDKFVLVEARYTHQGHPKPLFFEENKERFKEFLPKIEHVVVESFQQCSSTWDREHYQRNAIGRAKVFDTCQEDDIIILSDVDEIPKASVISEYDPAKGICAISMDLFYYKLNWKIGENWFKPRIFPYKELKGKNFQYFRGEGDYKYNHIISNGGWHFSFLGDKDSVKYKIQSYAHNEFNNETFVNDDHIEDCIATGKDIFKRDLKFSMVDIDSSFPKYVVDNFDKYLLLKDLISKKRERKIFDCFCFFNEVDLLEIRLKELYDHVDYFVISEMELTHSGKPKGLNFDKERFRWAKDKIIYHVPIPYHTSDPWVAEHYQRDDMMEVLENRANPEDIVIVSDLDEIPRATAIKEFKGDMMYFEQTQYSYYLNYEVGISKISPGTFSRITTYDFIRKNKLTLTGVRYYRLEETAAIKNGGWHFSWMGGPNKIVEKLESWAHQEFNNDQFKDVDKIHENISNGIEHFGRPDVGKFNKVLITNTFPTFVQNNVSYLHNIGLIDPGGVPTVAIVMPYYNDTVNLTKSVSAIMAQTFVNWHLFIVDDGSDMSKMASDILANHHKITIIYQKNSGPAAARNTALDKISTQSWFTHIAFCDSDDIWDNDFLEYQLNNIGSSDIVYSSVKHQFENGQTAYPYGIPDPEEFPGFDVMLDQPFIFISSVLCKASVLKYERFDTKLDSIEDWDMWLRLCRNGLKFFKNKETSITYTVRQGMASKRTEDKVSLMKHKFTNAKIFY